MNSIAVHTPATCCKTCSEDPLCTGVVWVRVDKPYTLLRLTLQIHVARRAPRFLYVSKSSSRNSSGRQDTWVAKTAVWTCGRIEGQSLQVGVRIRRCRQGLRKVSKSEQCLSEPVAPMPVMQQGNLDSPQRVFEFCIPIEVSKDVVVYFSAAVGQKQ